MSFGDYQWNEPYVHCQTKSDHAAVESLKRSTLSAAEESITYYRSLSHTLLGRDIPCVLLMHIGAFDVEMLPLLLSLYRSQGFQFVTLTRAESDGFYREDTDLHLPFAPDTLEGPMAERHLPPPPYTSFGPSPDLCC